MLIISGQRIYGRVDQVPGICYVATRFFHLYYVPLIPLSSWVIKQGPKNSSGLREQRIRLSAKSIVFAWLQAYLVIFGFVHAVWGAIEIATPKPVPANTFDGELKLFLGLLCLGAWLLVTIRPLRAERERANELLKNLGIEPQKTEEDVEWG